jgi:N-acyl amino acid synthase of PEP-CTERM/exosortase system
MPVSHQRHTGRYSVGFGTKVFDTPEINQEQRLLLESFRLRYQVYCVERQFLPVINYPRGVETDEFDAHAIHVGAVDRGGQLAGTARLVLPDHDSLPTFAHCTSAPVDGPLWGPGARWVEASRLSVSRTYGGGTESGIPDGDGHDRRDDRGPVFLAVIRGMYLASRRLGATHWLVSIEKSLQRLSSRNGIPLRRLGPQFDYLGPVTPYSLDLNELETNIRSGRYPQLAEFAAGPRSAETVPVSTTMATPCITTPGSQALPF